jgi:hypothetical protein
MTVRSPWRLWARIVVQPMRVIGAIPFRSARNIGEQIRAVSMARVFCPGSNAGIELVRIVAAVGLISNRMTSPGCLRRTGPRLEHNRLEHNRLEHKRAGTQTGHLPWRYRGGPGCRGAGVSRWGVRSTFAGLAKGVPAIPPRISVGRCWIGRRALLDRPRGGRNGGGRHGCRPPARMPTLGLGFRSTGRREVA